MKKFKFLLIVLALIISGCSSDSPPTLGKGPMNKWIKSGKVSAKVSAVLDAHDGFRDKTGLTVGLPKLIVDFDIRNDSSKKLTIDYIECAYKDGEGRSRGQMIINVKGKVVLSSNQVKDYKTDHNGWHIDVENCTFLIRVISNGKVSGKFSVDISHKLDPERSKREKVRRNALDEMDRKLSNR